MMASSLLDNHNLEKHNSESHDGGGNWKEPIVEGAISKSDPNHGEGEEIDHMIQCFVQDIVNEKSNLEEIISPPLSETSVACGTIRTMESVGTFEREDLEGPPIKRRRFSDTFPDAQEYLRQFQIPEIKLLENSVGECAKDEPQTNPPQEKLKEKIFIPALPLPPKRTDKEFQQLKDLVEMTPLPNCLIYDDCDEVRDKIREFIDNERISNRKFAQILGMTGGTIKSFLDRKGARNGKSYHWYTPRNDLKQVQELRCIPKHIYSSKSYDCF